MERSQSAVFEGNVPGGLPGKAIMTRKRCEPPDMGTADYRDTVWAYGGEIKEEPFYNRYESTVAKWNSEPNP